ncbi:MAG TPA: hypothetical protein VFX98_19650, partial [Longimicrobiaceae bacterium]|nr:hypothetical protein [Longimicrobiaceae bacterium]
LESAAPDEALRPALETLARLLGAPAAVRAAEVADACEQVARWAEERSAPATALAFLRAAVRAGRDIQRGRRPRVRGGKCEGGEAAGEGESWTGRGTSGKMGVFQV